MGKSNVPGGQNHASKRSPHYRREQSSHSNSRVFRWMCDRAGEQRQQIAPKKAALRQRGELAADLRDP
jgi:hypothetical protein